MNAGGHCTCKAMPSLVVIWIKLMPILPNVITIVSFFPQPDFSIPTPDTKYRTPVTRTMAKTAVANTHTMESESLHGEHSPRSPGCDHASAQYEHLDGPSVSTYGHANIGRDRTHNGPVDPVSGAHGASGSPVHVPFSKHG